jgi:hypothetical protein
MLLIFSTLNISRNGRTSSSNELTNGTDAAIDNKVIVGVVVVMYSFWTRFTYKLVQFSSSY